MKNVSGKVMLLLLVAVVMLFAGCGTALNRAVERGDINAVKSLLDQGADVNARGNQYGVSALIRAASQGHTNIARLLIEKGADVNTKTDDGLTALPMAAWHGHLDVARLLIEKGADIEMAIAQLERYAENDASAKAGIKLLEKFAKKQEIASQPVIASPKRSSDVDDLPSIKAKTNQNAYAIVIGIESYRQKLPKADFAAHDARTMTEYLTKVMGYPEENVITLTNDRAALGDLIKYFERWLPNNVEKDGNVFIYYSGHGAPNPKTGDAFLVPYDADPAFIDETGYSIKRLYDALGKLPAKEIVVAMDSCFSGAGGRSVIAKGARPLVMNLDEEIRPLTRNMTVFSASSGDEISSTYDEKGHGLFTYFFLKGLKGDGDANGDGTIDTGELYSYLKPKVMRTARKVYNNEQSPQIFSPADGKGVLLR